MPCFRFTVNQLPAGKFQLIVNDCMMEDAGDVKFSVGFVETKAKLKVDINEAWRAMMEEKKGGTSFNT